jgi:general secretion pathway protein G
LPSANKASHGTAWRQIEDFSAALEKFRDDCGRYPSTAEGLAALTGNSDSLSKWKGPYMEEIPADPWGNEYEYTSPGQHGAFDIVCLGEKGQYREDGGLPDDAVVSWAEGTLIGSWIEYMPTSALDIAIGDVLPSM